VDRELEVIHNQMEETRESLASKLGALESQVRETVGTASEAVTSTVEGVKDVVETVSETVGSVTETFNISKQVEENPWLAMGAAVAVGFVAAQLFGPSSRPSSTTPSYQPPAPAAPPKESMLSQATETVSEAVSGATHAAGEVISGATQTAGEALSSAVSDTAKQAGDAMQEAWKTASTGVGALAVGTLMGVVRELAGSVIPAEWKKEVNQLVDQVTHQLGGKPLQAERKEEAKKPETTPAPEHASADTPLALDRSGASSRSSRSKRSSRQAVGNSPH
jgi:ElaB/YqjD/DUF883 family membrane-anchored ribosome-binding protein